MEFSSSSSVYTFFILCLYFLHPNAFSSSSGYLFISTVESLESQNKLLTTHKILWSSLPFYLVHPNFVHTVHIFSMPFPFHNRLAQRQRILWDSTENGCVFNLNGSYQRNHVWLALRSQRMVLLGLRLYFPHLLSRLSSLFSLWKPPL